MDDTVRLAAARAQLDAADRLGQPAKLAPDTLRWLVERAEEAIRARQPATAAPAVHHG